MRNSIVDLIIFLAKRIRLGESLNEIRDDALNRFNPSEISAAYSWILQKHPDVAIAKKKDQEKNHRVLHFAERMLITPEAYGYLLEMVSIGIIDNKSLETIIEKVMFQSTEPVDLDKIKKIVELNLFGNDYVFKNHSNLLRGNETIN
jgi:uncharacterized protein Smg (DUF494 family)